MHHTDKLDNFKTKSWQASQMALFVKALAIKAYDLSSISRDHMVQAEKWLQKLFWPPFAHHGTRTHTHKKKKILTQTLK